jgi:WXG100 family type VII secretion target
MAGNTKLTPDEVRSIAQKHKALADEVTGDQRNVSTTVSNLTATNKGQMMTKLISVHQDWDKAMSDVVSNLTTMASTLSSAASDLQSHDESNAGAL